MFRHNFGGPPRQAPRQQGGQQGGQQGNPLQGLLHIIPVIILLLFTFLSSPSEPVSALRHVCIAPLCQVEESKTCSALLF